MAEEDKKLSDKQIDTEITKQLLNPYNFIASKSISDYQSSIARRDTYESVAEDDDYKKYIIKQYGSYENFLRSKKIFQDVHIFDPSTDYIIDVTVIKKEVAYKTDHMSAQEVILENLTGLCSVWFIKNNGSSKRLNCTLKKEYMTDIAVDQRTNFFSPQKYDRIGVWDVNEQKWKSFYMGRVFKFVRDDSIALE